MRGRVEWVGGGEGLGREGGRTISWRGRRWVLVAGGCCMVWWGIDEVGEREREAAGAARRVTEARLGARGEAKVARRVAREGAAKRGGAAACAAAALW